ncbi:hypothetical protein B0H19DRAFT_1079572 [Mycena capillaripes]|nr:hypothetical protein B0H19DRAFT_1079572 [Mycena capillaripes]
MNRKLSWEHEGWVNVKHRDALRCPAAELKARKGPTFSQKTEPSSSARDYYQKAMLLAKHAAQRNIVSPIDLSVPDGIALPGMSLVYDRQRFFYSGIKEEKYRTVLTRTATRKQLDLVKKSAIEALEKHVSDEEILDGSTCERHSATSTPKSMTESSRVDLMKSTLADSGVERVDLRST